MSELTDDRRGASAPGSRERLPQPPQIEDNTFPHQKKLWGVDGRPGLLPGAEPILPERLLRPATGPLNPRTGRRPVD